MWKGVNMANIYADQNSKIKEVIESLLDEGGGNNSEDILEVIEILLKRMEHKQKEKLCVDLLLEEYFSK